MLRAGKLSCLVFENYDCAGWRVGIQKFIQAYAEIALLTSMSQKGMDPP